MLNNWNINFWEYDFLQQSILFFLLLLPLLAWWLYKKERKRKGDWKYASTVSNQVKFFNRRVHLLRRVLLLLKVAIVALFIVALAKPYRWNDPDASSNTNKYGIDIVLALDVSLSMLATDLKPTRLDAAKEVAKEFVDGRRGDKVGLVVYAGEAYTACPMTLDYDMLKDQIDAVDGWDLEGGTAIGVGLGTAVVQLRSDTLKSKVIILLTDGSNNAGDISPLQAATLAKKKNICVYTIGVGSNGIAPTPVVTPVGVRYENMPVEIDENTLMEIAEETGGKYFRATDNKSLQAIYKEIDLLEKRKIEDKYFQAEPPATPSGFLNWALLLTLIVAIVEWGIFMNNE